MATKALHPVQNERLRTFVRAMLAGCDDNQSELARRIGVKQGQISEFLSGRKGAGLSLLGAISKYSGYSYDQLVSGDLDSIAVHMAAKVDMSGFTDAPTRTVVLDDRYPNRAAALDAWRRLGRDEEAAENVASLAMDRDDDPSPDEWFADLERERARLERERKGKAIKPPVVEDWDDAPRLPGRRGTK